MSYIPSIQIHNLFYVPTGLDKPLFQDLNLVFSAEKVGLIGRNGVGKSTLLKLIAGFIQPSQGSISSGVEIAMLAQDASIQHEDTVAGVIGIQSKLDALQRISAGSVDPNDYVIIGDDWTVEEKANELLDHFGLSDLSLKQSVASLSGGERTRLHLIRVFMSTADFILLDEPTNNLDKLSRERLYQEIDGFHGGLIIASHDRALLKHMGKIIELTTLGATVYGGNYDAYVQEKEKQTAALERQYLDAKKTLTKTKSAIQKTKEKHQERAKIGRNLRRTRSQSKLILDAQKERSTNAQGQLSKRIDRMHTDALEKFRELQEKIEVVNELQIDLSATKLPSGKVVIELKDVSFHYGQSRTIIKNFNLKIVGPERIALCGANGSGKSTLAKLIAGELKPCGGTVDRKITGIHYVDQHASSLDPTQSVLNNFEIFNSTLSEYECRSRLAQFLFGNKKAEKLVSELSGGEKLRALLACVLMAATPPELIILDEPTNHLDLDSILVIEWALQKYQGALIVISHDDDFLENIGIDKSLDAPFLR